LSPLYQIVQDQQNEKTKHESIGNLFVSKATPHIIEIIEQTIPPNTKTAPITPLKLLYIEQQVQYIQLTTSFSIPTKSLLN
jgi:hypothetical protein